ncbi:MAG TPA: cyclase family protein [Oscillatoriaceae cyanobacterium]
MPYVLSPLIHAGLPALWREGAPYQAETIYASGPDEPPIWYSAHTLRPHSLPHLDAPAHTQPGGRTVEAYFEEGPRRSLYGPALVVKLTSPEWQPVPGARDAFHWEVGVEALQPAVHRLTGEEFPPDKLLLTLADLPRDAQRQHDPRFALTLSREAAGWLLSNPNFNAYGTSYKSTDFQPGRRERPIHQALFTQAAIFECLDLAAVPEGRYFLVAFPLPLAGASESPVCPVLFEREELLGW